MPASSREISAAANAVPGHGGGAAAKGPGIPTSGSDGEEVTHDVNVSVPLVAILGAVVWMAWRYMGLRAWHLVVCLLFGFFLAATSAAPQIRQVVSALVQSLSQH